LLISNLDLYAYKNQTACKLLNLVKFVIILLAGKGGMKLYGAMDDDVAPC